MSSFKKKGSAKQPTIYQGARTSPASPATVVTSTGIPSFDDLLGGGLPLSCSMLVAAPDFHSSYGDLVQKYFVAQGLSSGQYVCVVDQDPGEFIKDLVWIPRSRVVVSAEREGDEDEADDGKQKIRIAWRYEQMKQFQTTVSSYSNEDFCQNFDLTSRIPESVISNALETKQLSFIIPRSDLECNSTIHQILGQIAEILKLDVSSNPIRICIPSLGSPNWGELSSQDILYFLHSLRQLLRRRPHACASVGLPPHLSGESWGGAGWMKKLGWVTDAAFTMSAFSANPSLTAVFPSHHGLLAIHTLPAPHTLVPLSDRFSTLRGLSASASSPVGSGENNLTFRCTRKRLIFETLHLDIEGGVGERKTTPLTTAPPAPIIESHGHKKNRSHDLAFATMEVSLEASKSLEPVLDEGANKTGVVEPKLKKGKKVAFRSDRPDLYDF
ncbi:Elongator complex protein 4 [Collybia nuda]|uniref:Elongator complex protein 4 n=1 Tax=Collybia nuda TaxID=64659 RepID=A0A9P5XWP2_9AGAR|nr:Elongator complex protein 4 [Collybia nuda]